MDIAICVIAFNRLASLKRLLSSLDNAVYPCTVKLYISVDKSDTNAVEKCAEEYIWKFGDKEVILHEENLGLRKHVINCGNLLKKHDAVIMLEDDIIVAPGFMLFARAAVEEYANRKEIAGISLYSFHINYHSTQPFIPLKEDSDVFMMQNAQSWGQVWMREAWNEFKVWYDENSGEFGMMPHLPSSICGWSNKSWLKYHTRYCIEKDKYFIYPYISYTSCFSDVGEHVKDSTPLFQTPMSLEIEIRSHFHPTVKYDTYFENQRIYEWLGMSHDELCIDYYGDSGNRKACRYWLSRLLLPFKVVKSFGLQLRPYELNIRYSVAGNDLFLYDTEQQEEVVFSEEYRNRQFFYLYGTQYIDKKSLEGEIEIYKQSNLSQKKTISGLEQTIQGQLHTISILQKKLIYWKRGTIVAFLIIILISILLLH